MPKLVTKFRYYKPGGRKKIGGYAKYIALREGAEKCEDTKKYSPATCSQKELIRKLIKDFPDSADMLEYEDYKLNPTVGNATEFISRAIEDNNDEAMEKKTYADYIATRPRVEKIGSHGLFSDEFMEIKLSEVSAKLNAHEGNVWTMIVSLRREDAERLGYNRVDAWQKLCRSHTKELANALRIPQNQLIWYAAFHNESHHPHIHLLAYADDPTVGYLSKKGVNEMRSALGNFIFHDEMQHFFREQTEHRNELKKNWKALLEDILKKISENGSVNPEIEQKLLLLSEKLSKTKGKKVYGYLKRDVKDLIDSIVDLLSKDENISKLYDLWYEKLCDSRRTFTSEMPPKEPLSQNKEFKSIKNEIIREAMRIHSEKGQTTVDPPKDYSSHASSPTVTATAITRLLKCIGNIFQNKMDDGKQKKTPTIDKRQKKEIEDKKNGELSML